MKKYCNKQDCVSYEYEVSARCMECYNASKYEPKPEERSDEQIPAVVRSKWPNKLQLSKLNEHGIGRDIELMMSAGSDTIDMEINEQGYEDSHYLSVCINKEMAVKIVNYLRNHYNI